MKNRWTPSPRMVKRVVIVDTIQARNDLARTLSASGRSPRVDRSPGFPEAASPTGGRYEDVHVQTVEATKKGGFWDGLFAIVAPMSTGLKGDESATAEEIASAALWDFAKAVDPFFLTDLIEHVTGIDELGETSEPPPGGPNQYGIDPDGKFGPEADPCKGKRVC